MAGQLIPPPELAPPPLARDMPPQQRYIVWLDMPASGEKLLVAGLRDKVGDGGDWKRALQCWYDQTEDDRLRHRIRRARELQTRRDEDAA